MEAETCSICLTVFTSQMQGLLEKCGHRFCLPCILKSSKIGNQCPIDRSNFTKIKAMDKGDFITNIPVQERKKRTGPIFYDFTRRCEKCQGTGSKLILCDGCDLAYHLHCLDRKLRKIPRHQWFCSMCLNAFNKVDKKKKVNEKNFMTKEGAQSEKLNSQLKSDDVIDSCSSSSSLLPNQMNFSQANQSDSHSSLKSSPVNILKCFKSEDTQMIAEAGSSKESYSALGYDSDSMVTAPSNIGPPDSDSCYSSCSSLSSKTLSFSQAKQSDSHLSRLSPVKVSECTKQEENHTIGGNESSGKSYSNLGSDVDFTTTIYSSFAFPDSMATVEISSSLDSLDSMAIFEVTPDHDSKDAVEIASDHDFMATVEITSGLASSDSKATVNATSGFGSPNSIVTAVDNVPKLPIVYRVPKPPFDKPVTLKYLKKHVYLLPTGLHFARSSREMKKFLKEAKQSKSS